MNNFLNNMERKYGKYAIPNLTTILIGCYVMGYVLQTINANAVQFMQLEPGYILRGQVWRLITWIVIPPYSMSTGGFGIFFVLIMLFFYFSIGSTLERTWGTFRYNVYIFGGMLFTLIAAFVCYFLFSAILGAPIVDVIGKFFTTYYVVMSMFLGFAATFPDSQVYLYFIIPIKVKWLGVLYFAMMIYDCGQYLRMVMQGNVIFWIPIIAFLASMMNFFIFFFGMRGIKKNSFKNAKRRRAYDKQIQEGRNYFAENVNRVRSREENAAAGTPKPAGRVPRHRCEVCGRTEFDDPNLEFRFCSKCEGDHEYCMEHLFTHVHVITDHAGKST